MPPSLKKLGIDKLSVEDRLALVEEIWNSIAATPEQLSLTDAQKQELDRRLADDEANPHDAVPWEVVKAEAQARSRR
jgi:putative addiction module component (TIGR02574 family)